ncbi:MAG TPA: hypothetical protein VN282_15670 [Pyrinomonadaceae bacterium]|nr:hypothetical protein [Pyrinomonadaceae bacterium]
MHPLAVTPDGTRLLAVNSPENRLSVFQLKGGTPVLTAEIPVGLEPVSVAARNDREAWALTFFLVDKLLRPGGWILFDDLNWTYVSKGGEQTGGISHRATGEDELNTPHIDLVFRLLVQQHLTTPSAKFKATGGPGRAR